MSVPPWLAVVAALGVPASVWAVIRWGITARVREIARDECVKLQEPCRTGCSAALVALERRVNAIEQLRPALDRLDAAVEAIEQSSGRMAAAMESIATKLTDTAELLARVDERTKDDPPMRDRRRR